MTDRRDARPSFKRHADIVAPSNACDADRRNGAVLFDTAADVASLDNHALRPEVIQAMETGKANRAGIRTRWARRPLSSA